MSTRPHARRPYDLSPSPTLVASPSASASTVSLPRYNTAGPEPSYGPRGDPGGYPRSGPRSGPGTQPNYSPEYRQKVEDSAAKLSIIVGVVAVFAGVLHLRKSKRTKDLARKREEQERSQRRRRQYMQRDHAARQQGQRDWDDWREQSTRQRIRGQDNGYSRRIEYPYEGGNRSNR